MSETDELEQAPPAPDSEPEPEPEPESDEPEDQSEEAEPPSEPAPQSAGPSEQEWEKKYQLAEKAVSRYVNAISTAFGDEAVMLELCPLCPPAHKGFVSHHDAGKVPDEVVNAVMRFLGVTQEVEYEPSPRHHGCTICKGLGKVMTGSRVPGRERDTCPECKGYGFLPPPLTPANGQPPSPQNVADTAQALSDFEQKEIDQFGEPRILPDGRENPNYGKWPQYKVPVEPWGITAGLLGETAATNA